MKKNLPKPRKSIFIHKAISPLADEHRMYYVNVKKVLDKTSHLETIAIMPGTVSKDDKERELLLSRNIVEKIEADHGSICPENLICNAHMWEYVVLYLYKDIDKINIIKQIPNSDNYLLLAANRDNGFYIVTHFETKSTNDKNLKRLLRRGNVISRGPSVCL